MGSRDHNSEIGLLAVIAVGVIILMGLNGYAAINKAQSFDASAYLVVLTLIVGAIKERWTQRSVDRMGDQLAGSTPIGETVQPVLVTNTTDEPVPTEAQK